MRRTISMLRVECAHIINRHVQSPSVVYNMYTRACFRCGRNRSIHICGCVQFIKPIGACFFKLRKVALNFERSGKSRETEMRSWCTLIDVFYLVRHAHVSGNDSGKISTRRSSIRTHDRSRPSTLGHCSTFYSQHHYTHDCLGHCVDKRITVTRMFKVMGRDSELLQGST